MRSHNTQLMDTLNKTFQQQFEAQVAITPNQVAARYLNHSVTYEQLNQQANQVAHTLKKQGVGPNILVGLYMHRSIEMLIQILAILKAGGSYLPLDPAYPNSRIAFILEDAHLSLVLTETSLQGDLESLKQQLFNDPGHSKQNDITILQFQSQESGNENNHFANPECQNTLDDLTYVIYTSGSTGQPKGVMVPHRGLTNYLNWCQHCYPLKEGKGSLVHSSISFDATITGLFTPLLVGKTVELVPEENEVEALAEALRSNEPYSLIKITPSHLRILNELLSDAELTNSTKAFVVGGEVLPGDILDRWRRDAPDVRIFNEYGPTETVVGCCVYEVTQQTDLKQPIPIGNPIDNMNIHILDSHMNPLPVGTSGEIYIGGTGVGLGYLNRPELTNERFLQSDLSEGKLYKSGDLARILENGLIEYLGRADDQLKIRGFRIEPGEIEYALIQSAFVKEAVVLPVEHEQGHTQLGAYLTVHPTQPDDLINDLRQYLLEQLPDYMIPTELVIVDQIPLTTNGKIEKTALLEIVSSQSETNIEAEEILTKTEEEIILSEIWSAVLNKPHIGLNDNFFSLGGDSILGIQMVARINKLGYQLKPRDLVKHQTLSDLAKTMAEKRVQAESSNTKIPEKEEGNVPLLPIQHWFFEKQLSSPHHYNFATLFTTPSGFQVDILEKVVEAFIHQHSAFRLRFIQNPQSKEWSQNFAQPSSVSNILEIINLSQCEKSSQSQEIERLSNQAQLELNIETGPLIKFLFFQCGQEEGRLLIVVHHLIMDGFSWRILFEDLQSAYQQIATGNPLTLEKGTTSLREWGTYLTNHYSTEEETYWVEQLKMKPIDFPMDYSLLQEEIATINTVKNSETIQIELSTLETEQLLAEVPKKYSTQVNEVLLTALNLSFSQWLGKGNLLIDLDGHGREDLSSEINLSRTIGWLTALFPFVLSLKKDPDLKEMIKTTKEQVRNIPNNGLGYGVLYYLKGRKAMWDPPPQSPVSFNYLGQFSSTEQSETAFALAKENCGDKKSPLMPRNNLIEIIGLVQNNQLQVSWTYCPKLHKHATIASLVEYYKTSLLEIIAHCVASQEKVYTPSDFSLMDIDQEELNFLMDQIK